MGHCVVHGLERCDVILCFLANGSNRIVRIDDDGLHFEADPRHVEMLLKASPDMNSVTSPGVRETEIDFDAVLQDELAAEKTRLEDHPKNLTSTASRTPTATNV